MTHPSWTAVFLTLIATSAHAGEAGAPAISEDGSESRSLLFRSMADSSLIRRDETDLARFFGGAFRNWGIGQMSIPVTQEVRQSEAGRVITAGSLGVRVDRILSSRSLVSLTARHGDGYSTDPERAISSISSASLSWQSRFRNDSGVTGRLFFGDQESRDRSIGLFSRRYVGVELEGRYALGQEHAPFAGITWQKNDYQYYDNGSGPSMLGGRSESQSRIAAGWSWQFQENWNFRAEANYLLAEDQFDPSASDRTQFYFRTRFGIR